ncbi:unnamed protein product [Schistocephalus solidus]|uniref:Reverse transcriptase domain-containing protein n=1 Tax=Schistocephalus solidus TaxID=70667 RepID=A0A183TED3_SCHSO|nr:unnamed protein product [Schistocephalus solidus]
MEFDVNSGVPQGSVLGSIVLTNYINDCANELDCDIAMFADYLKLRHVVQTAADEENLQANFNRLQKWSNDWLLPLNERHCNIILVGKSNTSNRTVHSLNSIPLKEVEVKKFLGVYSTPSFKPSLHCANVAQSAMLILYLCSLHYRLLRLSLWNIREATVGVRFQRWRPWATKDITIFENVDRRATKFVLGHGSQPYGTRLSSLNLFPLN